MATLQEKLTAAVTAGPVSHENILPTLDSRERFLLLDTVRDMVKRGQLRRYFVTGPDGKKVLTYSRVTGGG